MSFFEEGLERGEVRVQSCSSCGARQAPAGHVCRTCGNTDLRRAELSKGGKIYSTTTIHRAPDRAFAQLVPFDLAIADFGGGLHLIGHSAPGLAIGDPVQVGVAQIAGRNLLHFKRTDL